MPTATGHQATLEMSSTYPAAPRHIRRRKRAWIEWHFHKDRRKRAWIRFATFTPHLLLRTAWVDVLMAAGPIRRLIVPPFHPSRHHPRTDSYGLRYGGSPPVPPASAVRSQTQPNPSDAGPASRSTSPAHACSPAAKDCRKSTARIVAPDSPAGHFVRHSEEPARDANHRLESIQRTAPPENLAKPLDRPILITYTYPKYMARNPRAAWCSLTSEYPVVRPRAAPAKSTTGCRISYLTHAISSRESRITVYPPRRALRFTFCVLLFPRLMSNRPSDTKLAHLDPRFARKSL